MEAMAEQLAQRALRLIEQAGDLYYRLILLVALPGSGKTAALLEMARHPGGHYLNVNLELSSRLLELSERQRGMAVPRLLDEALGSDPGGLWLLDNCEILFDVSLKVDPLRLLQKLSRDRTLVVAWNGTVEDGYLTYAGPGHPEHRRYPTRDLVIVGPAPSPEGGSDEVP